MICAATLLLAGGLHADDSADVEKEFWAFTEAAVASDGESTAEIFSKSSYDYWDNRISEAKNLKKQELLELPTYRALNVVIIRERASTDPAVLQMDGKTWLSHSYKMGWNSQKALKTVVDNRELFQPVIEVDGEAAELQLEYAGQVLPTSFPFVKEAGGWKINGKLQFERLESGIEDKRKASGQSKEEYCNSIFKTVFSKAIDQNLWNPLEGD